MEYIGKDGRLHPYHPIYLSQWMTQTARFFLFVADNREGTDTFQFMTEFMKTEFRAYADEGSPKHLNFRVSDLYREYEVYNNYSYPHGKTYHGDYNYWCGLIYTRMQWMYHIPSFQLVDVIEPVDLKVAYYGMHTKGLNSACEDLAEHFNIDKRNLLIDTSVYDVNAHEAYNFEPYNRSMLGILTKPCPGIEPDLRGGFDVCSVTLKPDWIPISEDPRYKFHPKDEGSSSE